MQIGIQGRDIYLSLSASKDHSFPIMDEREKKKPTARFFFFESRTSVPSIQFIMFITTYLLFDTYTQPRYEREAKRKRNIQFSCVVLHCIVFTLYYISLGFSSSHSLLYIYHLTLCHSWGGWHRIKKIKPNPIHSLYIYIYRPWKGSSKTTCSGQNVRSLTSGALYWRER